MALKIFIEGEKYLVSYGCGHSEYNSFEELVEGLRQIFVPSKQSKLCIRCEEKEAEIGGYCSECNILASQERYNVRQKAKSSVKTENLRIEK